MKRPFKSRFIPAVAVVAMTAASIVMQSSGSIGHGQVTAGPCPVKDINTGICYTQIQPAVTGANPGDTILVYSGTYAGGIIVSTANLKLIAANGNRAVRVVGTGALGPVFGFDISGANNVLIQGFDISGFSGQHNASGIFVGGLSASDTAHRANGSILINNDIHDNGNGIYLWESNNNRITGNNIYHNLDFDGSEGVGILSFNGLGDVEVTAANASGFSGKSNLISTNIVYNNDRQGISVGACTELTLSCVGPVGVHDNISGTLIANNQVFENGVKVADEAEGIGFLDASGGVVQGNAVTHNNFHGIFINYSDGARILANTVLNNDLQSAQSIGGIRVNQSSGVQVTGNIVNNNNDRGIYVTSSSTSTFNGDIANGNLTFDADWDGAGIMTFAGNRCGTANPSKAVWHCSY